MFLFHSVVLALLATEGDPWTRVDTVEGITIESRPMKGSQVVELRLTTTVSPSPERLCEEAYGKGKFDPAEPNLKARQLLEERADERFTYDQISPPLVSQRDFAVRSVRERLSGGVCQVRFQAANDRAPKLPDGWVRIEKLKGLWHFEPTADGRTKLTHVIHSDPAGAIPPFLIEGSRRKIAVDWVKMVTQRAARPKP